MHKISLANLLQIDSKQSPSRLPTAFYKQLLTSNCIKSYAGSVYMLDQYMDMLDQYMFSAYICK